MTCNPLRLYVSSEPGTAVQLRSTRLIMKHYFSNEHGQNGYGAVHIFLTPAYNKINQPTQEEKANQPGFAGYDLDPFDPNQPQNFTVNFIVKYRIKTFRKADPKEVDYDKLDLYDEPGASCVAQYEDEFTFYVFSPWGSEKNAINQAEVYIKNRFLPIYLESQTNDAAEQPYIRHTAQFVNCTKV